MVNTKPKTETGSKQRFCGFVKQFAQGADYRCEIGERKVSGDKTSENHSRCVTSTSRSLLSRLRGNESDAWQRLVSLYAPMVYYWCRAQQVADQDMPDIVQEVFKSVSANINKFRKDRPQDTFRGWLRTITRNKVTDHYRQQQKQPKATGGSVAQQYFSQLPVEGEDVGSENEQAEGSLFLRALDLIRDDFQDHTWQAFWRVVVDGQRPVDVAEEMDMRPGTVRVAKSRVLHRLRQELGELLD